MVVASMVAASNLSQDRLWQDIQLGSVSGRSDVQFHKWRRNNWLAYMDWFCLSVDCKSLSILQGKHPKVHAIHKFKTILSIRQKAWVKKLLQWNKTEIELFGQYWKYYM